MLIYRKRSGSFSFTGITQPLEVIARKDGAEDKLLILNVAP